MDFYEENFKPLKNRGAFKLTDSIFDNCKDTFRVGCYRETKYGYILYCMNLKRNKPISIFSNTQMKRELETVLYHRLKEENLYVPEHPLEFSTLGYENKEYLGNVYRKIFFV